ncbi:hypothetical protein [Geomesophilobacter sediminis]|uniref:Uncharacterized protein n=1 Tax=Geomesophilobacter sediminis TaxID=2798584 RepID=A0A8J7J1C6_9BACT|nr:hypothetical protein [Geomesophilobacter sediminis]MBJ6724483.1 hypothetical protein [Geomesophilobacter sediminis]
MKELIARVVTMDAEVRKSTQFALTVVAGFTAGVMLTVLGMSVLLMLVC